MTYAGARGETERQMADVLHFILSQERLHPAFNSLDLTLYFNAAWAGVFEAAQTQDSTFHLPGGGQVSVPMMRQTGGFGYAEGEGYQAVELPYDGHELSMVVLLPRPGEFERFEGTLDARQVDQIVKSLAYRQVALTMPKFEFESGFSLKETLAALGMPDAFSDGADLSGMTGQRGLFIGDVVHQAFVSVDEQGTEAAAATAVMVAPSALSEEPVEVTMDRPFVFLIRDIGTGAILFVGRVVDPNRIIPTPASSSPCGNPAQTSPAFSASSSACAWRSLSTPGPAGAPLAS